MTDVTNKKITLEAAISLLKRRMVPSGDTPTPAITTAMQTLEAFAECGHATTLVRQNLATLIESDVSREQLFEGLRALLPVLQEMEHAFEATANQISERLR